MRSRAPLAAALLAVLAAGPVRAQKCAPGQFTPGVILVHCGGNPNDAMDRCKRHTMGVINACADGLKSGLIRQYELEAKPASPDVERELAAVKSGNEFYRQVLDEVIDAAVASAKPGGPFTAPDFMMFQGQQMWPSADLGELVLIATVDAESEAAKVKAALDAAGGHQTPPLAPETKKKALEVASRIYPGPPQTGSQPVQLDPKRIETAGDLFLTGGDAAKAEKAAKTLLDRDPKNARGPELLARGALAGGRLEEAERWAKKALELDPRNKEAKDALAFARAELSARRLKKPMVGNFDEARARDLDRGLAMAAAPAATARPPEAAAAPPAVDPVPRALTGLLRRGYEKMNLGDLAGALEDVSVHLDANPDDREARLVRAEVLLKLGKPESALADVDAALAKSPDDPRALRARAAALYELRRDEEALRAIEKALSIEPASGIGHLTRAKILERLGRTPEAIEEYRAAAQLDPSLSPIADAALRRLGAAPAAEPARGVERGMLRGGLIVFSLSLILLGLLGGAVVVTRRARTSERAAAAAREKTLGKGDVIGGQYRITRELGRGGMGVVFEAVDEKLKRPVAVKQLQGDFRVSAEEAARFLQEARLVAQLKHPNVAAIHAAVEDGGLFLVFELVKGRPLDLLLGSGVTPEQARGIVAHVCAALTAAHSRRIVHRDLKPSNLMVTDDGEIKVMDFGIAHQSINGGDFTKTSASGTPPYMAPEQAMGSVSASSDLYALGVMAYELLAGARPFDGPDFLGPKMRGEFPPVTAKRRGLPPALDAFFASALSPDPTRRPADAKAFASAFAACWP